MKLGSEVIAIKATVPVAICRGDVKIVMECGAVTNEHYEEFEELVPQPEPPKMLVAGKGEQIDFENKAYLDALADYRQKRFAFMTVRSLLYTPGLSFDTVDIKKPDTYMNLDQELADAGFMPVEIVRIRDAVYEAQGISQEKVDAALESFLKAKQDAKLNAE